MSDGRRRRWPWFVVAAVTLAGAGIVLVNGAETVARMSAPDASPVAAAPDNGGPVLASPPMAAATTTTPPGTTTTQARKPAPTSAPGTTTTVPPDPSAAPGPSSEERAKPPPRITISVGLPWFPVYYRDCEAARAAHAAPVRRGQPGYRDELDGDRDGVACER